MLGERVSSPRRLAAELDEPLGRVGHHVRVLARIGAIELVDTAQRRGVLEHFYRAVVRPLFSDEQWASVPRGTRRAVFGRHLARIVDDVAAAGTHGGFDHPRALMLNEPFDLDREGFDAVADILIETVLRVFEERSAGERRGSREAPGIVATELAVFYCERT